VKRIALWLVALTLGSLAGRGIDANLAGTRGWPALVAMIGVTVVTVFVAVSIVTAMESLFPSLHHRFRRTRHL
jgi:hypothetical protein